MLPDGEYIHTFRQARAGMLLGADWGRADILAHIEKHGAELSGETATRMDHGMVVLADGGALFIETRKAAEYSG